MGSKKQKKLLGPPISEKPRGISMSGTLKESLDGREPAVGRNGEVSVPNEAMEQR